MQSNEQKNESHTLSHSNWRRTYVSTHLFIHTYTYICVLYMCVCVGVLFCSILQSFLIGHRNVITLLSTALFTLPTLLHFTTQLCSSLLFFPAVVLFFAVLASAQCISLAAVVRTTFRFARTTYASSIFCNPMQTTPLCCCSSASETTRLLACLPLCFFVLCVGVKVKVRCDAADSDFDACTAFQFFHSANEVHMQQLSQIN